MNYAELTELEWVDVVSDFTESWVTGLTDEEIKAASADVIKSWMIFQADDARYSGADWADMINNMTSDELVELSEAVKRKSEEWISEDEE